MSLRSKLKRLQEVFHERNGYPHWFITKVMNEVKRSDLPREHFQGINRNENEVTCQRTLLLPYAGEKGCSLVRSLKKQLKRSPLNNMKPNIVFTSTRLSSNFRQQLVKSLVTVICMHVVKVYNNYASTLVIYKVFSFLTEIFHFHLLFIFYKKVRHK